jgi:hypothetical protein
MPSKHRDGDRAVTWRFDAAFVARLRAAAAAQGEGQGKVWVRRVLEEAVERVEREQGTSPTG